MTLPSLAADALTDPHVAGLDVYVVGGAVRDALLGLPAGDRDWVVVGASPQTMVDRGFLPVGDDFPVFLHPRSREEYALARTERKSGKGYRGFVFYAGPDVTLEQDLQRRDLTVNAIAQAPDGSLIDPTGGRRDLENRVLRHVGPAFVEDPVRVLRLARFAARFPDFQVAQNTLSLCQQMAADGEVDALVPERVWKEVSRGIMHEVPSRMFVVLDQAHALERVAPEWYWALHAAPGPGGFLELVDAAAEREFGLPARYGASCIHVEDAEPLNRRMRVPNECADFARLLKVMLRHLPAGDADAVLGLIERCDGLRKPDRFMSLLAAAQLCVPVDLTQWRDWLRVVREVDAGAVARAHRDHPAGIRAAVRQARLAALQDHGVKSSRPSSSSPST